MLLYDQLNESTQQTIRKLGPKMSVTNVSDYYYNHEKEFWAVDDFPCPRPPFDSMWLEYRFPSKIWSKEVGETDVSIYRPQNFTYFFGCFVTREYELLSTEVSIKIKMQTRRSSTPGEWGMFGGMWAVDNHTHKATMFKSLASLRFDLGEDGNCLAWYANTAIMGTDPDKQAERAYLFHPILMAFSFCNCKNIEMVEVTHPRALQKARIARNKQPFTNYHVVNVLPFGKCYKPQTRQATSSDTHLALQIRRGNYARYGEKFGRGKLFGKYDGMFWRPQTVVGDPKAGVIDHDYEVKK